MDTLTQIEHIINYSRMEDESCIINPRTAAERVMEYLEKNELLVINESEPTLKVA